jgi:membrane protein insertase Oxa1/YidC/SpoIIIJ
MVLDVLRGGLFSLAHFCGGSMGLAIVVASLGFRVLMLPLSIRAARRQAIQPGRVGLPDAGSLAQLPLGIALYSAIRGIGARAGGFLWVKTLSRPDRTLAIVGALIAGGLSWLTASSQTLTAAPGGAAARGVAVAISAIFAAGLTLTILFHMPAGVALYSITSSIAGFGERRLIARLTQTKEAAKR